jgi:imidazoleglycerol-phosphate dehydratase/histidinol-phosphatase
VIGDRITDVMLAKNLNCKAIWINTDTNLGSGEIDGEETLLNEVIALATTEWKSIYEYLKLDSAK